MKTLSPEIQKEVQLLKAKRPEPKLDDFLLSEEELHEAEEAIESSRENDWLKLIIIIIGITASIKSFLMFDDIIIASLAALFFSGLSMMLVVVFYGWIKTTRNQKALEKPLQECSVNERYRRYTTEQKAYYKKLYKDAKILSETKKKSG